MWNWSSTFNQLNIVHPEFIVHSRKRDVFPANSLELRAIFNSVLINTPNDEVIQERVVNEFVHLKWVKSPINWSPSTEGLVKGNNGGIICICKGMQT